MVDLESPLIDSKLKEWLSTGLVAVERVPFKKKPQLRVTLRWMMEFSYREYIQYEEKKYLFGLLKRKKVVRRYSVRLSEEEIKEKENYFLDYILNDLKIKKNGL